MVPDRADRQTIEDSANEPPAINTFERCKDTRPTDEAGLIEWHLWKEHYTQARIDQCRPLTVEQDLQLAVRAILPDSQVSGPQLALETGSTTSSTQSQSTEPTILAIGSAPTKLPTSSNEDSRKTSARGKRLGPSEWKSKYNGCRRCGEEMELLTHRSGPMTQPILQAVVKLLALLSVMPWDVMIEFLQQLRTGQVDRRRWPVALQDAMSGTAWFDKLLYQAIY